jgi:phasin
MTETAKTQTPKVEKVATVEDAMAAVPAGLREMTERGLDQAKTAYDQIKGNAQEAVELLDGSADALKAGTTEFNTKTIEYAQSNINAGFEFARKLVAAKDVKELVELQSAFARDQFTAYTNQVKDLSELTAKVAERTSKPLADGVKKSFEQAKQVFPAV